MSADKINIRALSTKCRQDILLGKKIDFMNGSPCKSMDNNGEGKLERLLYSV